MSDTIIDVEARFHQSLPGLASKWRTFAEDVESGYGLAIDNYTNSLTVRDMLDEAMGALEESDRRWLVELADPSDARFMRATHDDQERLLSRFKLHNDHWWWNRVPIVLGALAGDYGIYAPDDPRRSA